CGCSVDEVHEDMLERYRRLERTVSALERAAMASLGASVLNPLPWRRRRLVGGTLLELEGFQAAAAATGELPRVRPRRGRTIANDRFRVEAARNGTLTVTDLHSGLGCSG